MTDFGRSVLLTGATGYVGGRLAPRLLEAGHRVRCLVRSPEKLSARTWIRESGVEVVQGDLDDPASVRRAMEGCGAAFYLVHSMEAAKSDDAERDRRLAEGFARAAGEAGLERIVYLGGLGEMGPDLSEHLRSRREVEEALASGPAKLTVLRAAMVIGSGSASFEILRYLVERLPVMITPRWVRTECQPIAIRNVLGYLVAALRTPETVGRTLDIGGTDVLNYAELMQVMADELGIRRRVILPVPVLTHPDEVNYGEALDFWRVTGIEPRRRLTLRAEMKLPGVAELEFEMHPLEGEGTRLVQTARFRPLGHFGLAYWYAVLPLHHIVFKGMLEGIRREAVGGGK